MEELQLLIQELKNTFSLSFLESFAHRAGMIRHKRKCKAQDIVSLCVFLSKTVETESFARLFHQNICSIPSIGDDFKRIRILDSTMFQLPHH